MEPGQIVTCELAFNQFAILNNNAPLLGEELVIAQVKQAQDLEFIRFAKYDRQNMKLFFNSVYFA